MKYDITKDYNPVGDVAVDSVASCIIFHRRRNMAIKSIYLKDRLYDRFKSWVESQLQRTLEVDEKLSWDNVDIEKGNYLQKHPLQIELFNDFNRNLGLS